MSKAPRPWRMYLNPVEPVGPAIVKDADHRSLGLIPRLKPSLLPSE